MVLDTNSLDFFEKPLAEQERYLLCPQPDDG